MAEVLVALLALVLGVALGVWWSHRYLVPTIPAELQAELDRIDARELEGDDTLDEEVPPGTMDELLEQIAERNRQREARR